MPTSNNIRDAEVPTERFVFGSNFREARKRLGLTQFDIHKRAGINRAFLSEIERGQQNVSLDLMAKLANIVNVPLHRLLKP